MAPRPRRAAAPPSPERPPRPRNLLVAELVAARAHEEEGGLAPMWFVLMTGIDGHDGFGTWLWGECIDVGDCIDSPWLSFPSAS